LLNHRIYQYTSIGRPLHLTNPSDKAILVLMPVAAILGAVVGWYRGASPGLLMQQALWFLMIFYGSWALARELDPDDKPAAFISMAVAIIAAIAVTSPGILIVFTTMGLVRIVNRSSGLAARKTDSFIVMVLAIWVIYATESPFFGAVAALAFIFDGSLREPLRAQWVFALVCFGGSVVYMVDHDVGFALLTAPNSLFAWLSVLFLLLFALDTLLLKKVHSKGDFNGRSLDAARVRGGMVVGLCAALQGIARPDGVVIIVAVIAGIGIGMAFRKGFKAPAVG